MIVADDEDPARAQRAGRVRTARAGWSDTQWKEAVATLHAIARALRDELGMRVVVHHHAGTFVETPAEIDRLLKETDPSLVGLLLDTGHAAYGGADPVEVASRHAARIRYVHLKDVRADELARAQQPTCRWTRPGSAACSARWAKGWWTSRASSESLRRRATRAGSSSSRTWCRTPRGGWYPEPSTSARKSREYLKRLGL